jgi:hypothetical protein
MKTLTKRITLIFATVFTAFSFYISPVIATAENNSETAQNSSEIVSVEEELDKEESVENSAETSEDETKAPTLEDVLDFAESEAEKAGLGDEWREALKNIKNAVDEKKIDLMTIASFTQLLAMIVYFGYKIISNIKLKKVAANLSIINQNEITNGKTLQKQTETLQAVSKDEEKILEAEKNISTAILHTNDALLHMVEGIKFAPERKTAAIRALNKSNAALDGGDKHENKTL